MSTPTTYRGGLGYRANVVPPAPPGHGCQPSLTAGVIPRMTTRTSARHNLPVALFLTTMLLVIPVASAAAMVPGPSSPRAVAAVTHHPHRPPPICPIKWRRGPKFVRRLVVCAAAHYHVPGGVREALYVANRESHFHARAYNAWSGALGIYQHLRRYWPGRAAAYGFKGWSGFNARANILVTMRMVRRLGNWSPWGM